MSETLLAPDVDRDITALNAEFKRLSPRERIGLARRLFGDQLVFATTFGPTAPLLLQYAEDTPVVNVRHGHETEKTLEHAELYTHRFNLRIHTYEPLDDANLLPKPAGVSDFQWRAKIEPFQRALLEHNARAYISGAMEWQTDERKDWPFVEQQGDVFAIRPLLDMTANDVDKFFDQTKLPQNTDYYDPTKGADQKQECQLNTVTYVGHRAVAGLVDRSYITLTS